MQIVGIHALISCSMQILCNWTITDYVTDETVKVSAQTADISSLREHMTIIY